MRIGGFIKQSLMDYPGKIAAVVFTQGCNFRCGYCHNPQLVLPKLFLERFDLAPLNIINYLEQHRNWLDGVVVTGGEPTIHKDLLIFLKEIKALGFSVKLDTNGTNPQMLERIIKNKLVDYVAMDIKVMPEKDLYGKITGIQMTDEIIEKIMVSILLLKNTPVEIEFRTTYIPGIHSETTIELIKSLVGKNRTYNINHFRDGNTVDSFYQGKYGHFSGNCSNVTDNLKTTL